MLDRLIEELTRLGEFRTSLLFFEEFEVRFADISFLSQELSRTSYLELTLETAGKGRLPSTTASAFSNSQGKEDFEDGSISSLLVRPFSSSSS